MHRNLHVNTGKRTYCHSEIDPHCRTSVCITWGYPKSPTNLPDPCMPFAPVSLIRGPFFESRLRCALVPSPGRQAECPGGCTCSSSR